MSGKVTEKEINEIRRKIRKEFPEDPALQQLHIARKIIAKEAERAGTSYAGYIRSWKQKQVRKGQAEQRT